MNNSVSNLTNISVVTPIKSNSEIGISARPVKFITLPDGILDAKLLERVGAIVQQENCIGCDGRGLADAIAKKLPYGCSYKNRRRMPPANKFAVPDDRSTPGTIDVRKPPTALSGTNAGCPIVINLFAQWGMGAPGKYNRVSPAPPSDSARTREYWFRDCLHAIAQINPPLESIAFPYKIGCGLAGGNWVAYEAMIFEFAAMCPMTQVIICKLDDSGKSRGTQRRK